MSGEPNNQTVIEFLESILSGDYGGDFTHKIGGGISGKVNILIRSQEEIDALSKLFKDKNPSVTGSDRSEKYNPALHDNVLVEVSTDSDNDKKFSFSSGSKSLEVKSSDYTS